MKKIIFSLAFLVVMAFSGSVYAAQSEEMDCCQSKKECMEICEEMNCQMDCCEMTKNGKMKMKDCKKMMKKSNIDCC
ncbi:hypothetical protein [Cytobacillus firmus]|uniref:Uncharacterized protein n=1 Tax=Cytobacillus firmus TaxID=1399 RepID=A0AA46PV40_CYTFI|nr:hypothetical protein [Cytobacillus firmus]UYG98355.1 hypothetical protein OD459_26175 [Cytobacillus firmus]